MSLAAGTRLGPYEILGPLGSGGMGEVYRARDPRLNRDVAIKTSAARFSERFEREAHAIAALNHPHICQIYDVGPDYLVMELVDGAPVKGPLPLDQALKLAIQLAGAIAAAHHEAITHRDLKPANILNTKSGIKVLDFGLAKIEQAKAAAANDETVTRALTQEGAIVGTLQYMAPEQLNGKTVDSRADIFSFGCVLYEMLTGKRAFDGATAASVIGAILEREAPSVGDVAPAALDRLVKRCLAKDPDDRWQSARDLKDELAWIASGGGAEKSAPSRSRFGTVWPITAGVLALALAALAFIHFRERPPEAAVVRFTIPAPPGTRFSLTVGPGSVWPVLSPDGRKLAFRAVSPDGGARLWVRSLDALTAQPLPGTENGAVPFWSPDSTSIGFDAGSNLNRIDIAGGPVITLAASVGVGTWSPEGAILFARVSAPGPLYRVPASGGAVTTATQTDAAAASGHHLPWFLPDGKNFLFVQGSGPYAIRIGSLGSTDSKALGVSTDGKVIYASGHLLFNSGETLMAQPFDADRLATTGDAVPIAERVAGYNFGVSSNGTLVYAEANANSSASMIWFDRQGKKLGALGDPAVYTNPALSPDGKRLAVGVGNIRSRNIWVFDLTRGVPTRFTFDSKDDLDPVWSPDGSQIAFTSNRSGARDVYRKAASGAGPTELLVGSKDTKNVEGWSPDGKFVLYNLNNASVWAVPVAGDHKPFPVLKTPFSEQQAAISPDGHWIAYLSNESGKNEIFIQSFPPAGGKWQISNGGGHYPSWRGDGKELFYVNGTKIMAADIRVSGASVEAGLPHELFDVPDLTQAALRNSYLATPDGKRFLCMMTQPEVNSDSLIVVRNWPSLLKK